MDHSLIKSKLEELSASPLYHLFGASKELFHSNFLFWLATINRSEFLKAFSITRLLDDFKIEREKKVTRIPYKAQVDFLLQDQTGNSIVIENKVKDYPTQEQLERVYNSTSDAVEHILLSLSSIESGRFDGWRVLSYRDLSEGIDPLKFSQENYHSQLIQDYKQFIWKLSEITDLMVCTEIYDFANSFSGKLYVALNEYSLWEMYQRIRGSHLIEVFNNRYCSDPRILTGLSINNQKATLDFYVKVEDDVSLGIQLENNQYRRFILSKRAIELSNKLVDAGLFFTHNHDSPRGFQFLKYGSVFRYQYEKLHSPGEFKLLLRAINDDLRESVLERMEDILAVFKK